MVEMHALFCFFAFFVWDPDRNLFVIRGINHPVTWYGLLFATGFLGGYFLARTLFFHTLLQQGIKEDKAKKIATHLTDRLTLFVIIGTLIGARLGHVFFYDWTYYRMHLIDIFKIWEGGLASHGAAIGILVALICFVVFSRKEYPFLTWLMALDAIVIPTAFAGGCIRVGNFLNQEILGTPTTLPWGVIFLHPVDGIAGVPLHPVQIYEALFYFAICFGLFFLWSRRGKTIGQGLLAGLFFILVFGFRFAIEGLKLPQSTLIDESASLNMGQWLSLPFILFGAFLLAAYLKRRVK